MSALFYPTYWWFPLGLIAFLIAGVNLVLGSMNKKTPWRLLVLLSLVFALFALLAQYHMVNTWVQAEDWSALMDVVPTMSKLLTGAVIVGVGLNVMVIVQNMRKK